MILNAFQFQYLLYVKSSYFSIEKKRKDNRHLVYVLMVKIDLKECLIGLTEITFLGSH